MIRTIFVLSTVLLFCCPAGAATVDAVKGKVLINRGDGFQQATSGAQANAGDRLMANAGGSATLVYPGMSGECNSGKSGERGQKAAVHGSFTFRGSPVRILQQSTRTIYNHRGCWVGYLLRYHILP